MLVEHIILALVLILALSLLALPVSRFLHLPFSSTLVVIGFLVSELIVYLGYDTGLRADNFQHIIFYVFIPILVFEAAYSIDKQALKNNIIVILFLAIVAMMLTAAIAAILLFYGIGHETGFPWLAALITGSILAATDPVAVVDKLKEMNAPKRISVLLEGESLFNDATAIVLFGLFLSMAVAMETEPASNAMFSAFSVIIKFLIVFIGGGLTGLLLGLLFSYIHRKMNQVLLTGVMTLILAYGSFLLAEHLMVSGVMSTLLAALSFSVMTQVDKDAAGKDEPDKGEAEVKNSYLWHVLSHVANVSVFLVVGAVVTVEMFEQRWLAMLIAIAAILLARAVSVYGVLGVFSLFKSQKVSIASQTVMVWGGLRGAVTLALALALPTSLDYWWTIQSIAFGVVLFSLFVQAPTIKMLAKKLLH